jgi:uncharacterized Zn finger protein
MTTPSLSVQAKAATYLLERRVRIVFARGTTFSAHVRGGRTYHVSQIDGVWRCDCPATTDCAHIIACQAVWQPAESDADERRQAAERGRKVLARIGAKDDEPW